MTRYESPSRCVRARFGEEVPLAVIKFSMSSSSGERRERGARWKSIILLREEMKRWVCVVVEERRRISGVSLIDD